MSDGKTYGEAFFSLLENFERASEAKTSGRGQVNSQLLGKGRHGNCNRSRGNYSRGRNNDSSEQERSSAQEVDLNNVKPKRPSELHYERNSQYGGRGRGRIKPVTNTRFANNSKDFPSNRDPGSSKKAGHYEITSKSTIKNTRNMELKDLENLLTEDPNSILKTVANPSSGFSEMLNGEQLEPKLLMLIVGILKKVYESEYEELKISVYSKSFSGGFIDEIKRCCLRISLEDNQEIHEHVDSFFSNVIWLFDRIIAMLPSLMNERLKSLMVALNLAMKNLKDILGIDLKEHLFEQVHIINEQISSYIETKKKIDSEQQLSGSYIQAPNDFRELSLVPTSQDFVQGKTFLNPNIVKGAYKSVEHYLDVQFRLLREDFIAPLREGIHDYIENLSGSNSKRKYSNVRIYSKVKFMEALKINNETSSLNKVKDKFSYLVSFDCDKKLPRNINWEYNKRFLFGSLLLFSNDNFNTFYVATVVDRDMKLLQERIIGVTFVPGTICPENLFDPSTFFVMAESEVYYEAYLPVLSALKRINENNFPMKQYIVDADTKCFVPVHILFKSVYKISGFQVNLLDDKSWPSPDQLELNPSQLRAFKSALTNEFSVIQGPPGTGKTFLALKITEVLLKNYVSNETPIVVICYTNHALDQFLEAILKYTNNLIRIGGQSQNDTIKKFNINTVRSDLRKCGLWSPSEDLYSIRREKYELEDMLEATTSRINKLNTLNNGIVKLKELKTDMMEEHYHELLDKEVEWLLGYDVPSLHPEQEEPQTDMFQTSYEGQSRDLVNDQSQPFLASQSDSHVEEEIESNDDNALRLADVIEEEEEPREDWTRINYYLNYSLTFENIINEIRYCEDDLVYYKSLVPNNSQIYLNWENDYIEYIQGLRWQIDFVGQQLHKFKDFNFNTEDVKQFQKYKSVWEMKIDDRWKYYISLISVQKCRLRTTVQELTERYHLLLTKLSEVSQMSDLKFLRDADVIGMTTSGAAKRRLLLENLDTKIVIVEEAAEVLEAHIVSSLAQSVQHVILIGDHKQLKPSPAVIELAKKYQFNVSLFERMLVNGLDCSTLDVQHRMRPEIASLIAPSIYPTLINHPITADRTRILGVDKFVFFLNHNHLEDQLPDALSCQNTHEADFLLALCNYLLLQGYQPHEITILTAYVGQVWYLKKQKKKLAYKMPGLKEVRITPVDNFQGEENRIILLSLVRSNKEGNIGFLGTENRVCVALSRARDGFYIIGNLDMLVANNLVWPQVKQTLQQMNAVGRELVLRCERHPDQVTRVSSAYDFSRVPEGGCAQPCQTLLDCGHHCPRVCHITDRDHGFTKCDQLCTRKPCAEEGHVCPLKCGEQCLPCEVVVERELPCGHSAKIACHVEPASVICRERVPALLELCGHTIDKPCFLENTSQCRCSSPCNVRLPCGHSCTLKCHLNDDPDHLKYKCYKPCCRLNENCHLNHTCVKLCHEPCGTCTVLVKVALPCKHYQELPCAEDKSKIVCTKPCTKTLPCGHRCSLECNLPCNPNSCKRLVDKECPHGHILKNMKCGESAAHRSCKELCPRLLPCGHPCPGRCGDVCADVECQVLVTSQVAPACGHPPIILPCFLNKSDLAPGSDALLRWCKAPCEGKLKCDHTCTGTCSSCMQGRLHVPCSKRCSKVLLCGHRCQADCKVLCPPCREKCSNICEHNFRCRLKCSESCKPCTKPCTRGCTHRRCPNKCGYPCEIMMCNEPCTFKLQCGHECIGFCGEKHPPLCRVCDADNPIIAANPNSRFVVLAECNHVVDVKQMPQGLYDVDRVLCPHCSKAVIRTRRYRNVYLRQRMFLDDILHDIIGERNELRKVATSNAEKCMELIKYLPPEDKLPEETAVLLDIFLNMQKNTSKKFYSKERAYWEIVMSLLLPVIERYCVHMMDYHGLLIVEDWRRGLHQRLAYLISILPSHLHGVSYEDILQMELEVSRIMRAFNLNRSQHDSEIMEYWLDINTYTKDVVPEVDVCSKMKNQRKYSVRHTCKRTEEPRVCDHWDCST